MQMPEVIRRKLDAVPPVSMRATLVRMVAFAALSQNEPPDWLFTSGKPNRFNPPGVECLYFAEDEATARAEYNHYGSALPVTRQPVVTYYAEVNLQRVWRILILKRRGK